MLKKNILFAKHDSLGGGMIPVADEKAKAMNEQGYGIFRTVNGFNGRRRRKVDLLCINGWHVEIDNGEKADQLKKIQSSILEPSLVVESKRGYQIIFGAKDASFEKCSEINKYGLVPFFDGDPNACDVSRVLREPGYYHLKDPSNPFLIRIHHKSNASYSENEILSAFPLHKLTKPKKLKSENINPTFKCKNLKIPNEEALLKISGIPEVNHEVITIAQNYNGTKQIVINGQPSSCWIDSNGKIGSYAGGGPTIIQWLQWYGHNLQTIKMVLKKHQIIK